MKKLLFILFSLFVSSNLFSQNMGNDISSSKDQIAIGLINDYFKQSKNFYNAKLIEYNKIDTLYSLSNESEKFQKESESINEKYSYIPLMVDNSDLEIKRTIKNDPGLIYLSRETNKAKRKKKMELYKDCRYLLEIEKGVVSDNYYDELNSCMNEQQHELDSLIMVYTPEQKGWKMKCRISKNGGYQSIEVYFDLSLCKITDILTEEYARIYEEMLHPHSAEQYKDLSEIYNNRGKLF